MNDSTRLKPFNAAEVHQELLALPQYSASPMFRDSVQWRGNGPNLVALPGGPTDPIEAVSITTTGTVGSRVFLAPHGTFNPAFPDPMRNTMTAKLQLDILRPSGDDEFGEDFNISYMNISSLQDDIAKTPCKNYFLIKENGVMQLNFALWEPKTNENDVPVRNALTAGYTVNPTCAPWFDIVKQTHQIRRLPVYDCNEMLNTKPETWEQLLVGALVEVTYTLTHYHMGINSVHTEASDTFTAKLESISVLRPPPPVLRSPMKEISPRKPPRTPQTGHILQQRISPLTEREIQQPDFSQAPVAGPSGSKSSSAGLEDGGGNKGNSPPPKRGKRREREDVQEDAEDEYCADESPSKKSK